MEISRVLLMGPVALPPLEMEDDPWPGPQCAPSPHAAAQVGARASPAHLRHFPLQALRAGPWIGPAPQVVLHLVPLSLVFRPVECHMVARKIPPAILHELEGQLAAAKTKHHHEEYLMAHQSLLRSLRVPNLALLQRVTELDRPCPRPCRRHHLVIHRPGCQRLSHLEMPDLVQHTNPPTVALMVNSHAWATVRQPRCLAMLIAQPWSCLLLLSPRRLLSPRLSSPPHPHPPPLPAPPDLALLRHHPLQLVLGPFQGPAAAQNVQPRPPRSPRPQQTRTQSHPQGCPPRRFRTPAHLLHRSASPLRRALLAEAETA
mmetsp:Transcript_68790/g.201478  ORF Transcript_68790/g.201478 Transcript_68790/m.201478 type:complete len:316 (-) Transcript_68790:3-950(-)